MNNKHSQNKREQMRVQDEIIQKMLHKIRHKIIVLSGKGGVGKSTVAVMISRALAKAGYKTGLMDVDLHGPSIPRILGLSERKPESADGKLIPVRYSENLGVVSIGNLLEMEDQAVIWRGPMKIGAIRQFLSDVAWEELDFLIIDSPPGTGDEPLTVAQTIPGARAIIVTTPQELSLADVRKSINFCRAVNLPVLGIVENMSGYICPQCGYRQDIFGTRGGERTANDMGLELLGRIPIDPAIVQICDKGMPDSSEEDGSVSTNAFRDIVSAVIATCEGGRALTSMLSQSNEETHVEVPNDKTKLKIAIPTSEGLLASHFGHCSQFTVFAIEDSRILRREAIEAPPHEPGILPRWLSEKSVNVIIAGGMGARAQGFFADYGIEVVTGAPQISPDEIVARYLDGTLQTGPNICDH